MSVSPSATSIAGPSRTPTPPPSTSRIEHYSSSTPSTSLMITTRAKRSTAGNRLKALLDQELEKDELFTEVENDIDFEANDNEVDIVDSDFDRDSDDDARQVEDESEGERELEELERAEKSKRRAAARNVGIVKRPAAPAVRARRAAPPPSPTAETEPKRRRISFAPDQPSTSSAPLDSRRRSSARSATVQSKRQVESRLEEAEQRRAAQPVKHVVKKKASLTQDALIAEALEVEEENRESLRRFLEQEEERRAKQRQRKERITGPFVRWMSVGVRTKRVVEEVKVGEEGEKGAEGEKGKDERTGEGSVVQGSGEGVREGAKEVGEQGAEQVSTPPPPSSVQPAALADAQSKEVASSKDGDDDVAMADASTSAAKIDGPTSEGPKPSDTATRAAPPQPRTELTTPTPTSTAPTPVTSTSTSLTLDPVIAARQQASLLRSSSSTVPPPPTTAATSSSTQFEMQARTLLSIERAPSDWTWLDEFSSLLGSHCDWDSYPFVPSRNRPLRPRQSICPITGLPALYKDPRTGIAYANAYAYGVITKVVRGEFVWSGGHYERRIGGDEKGKKRERGGGGGGGKVGTGAVPPEMGVWFDDESEKGATGVWETARQTAPTPHAKAAQNEAPPTTPAASNTRPTATRTASTPASESATPSTATAAAKNKQKPGFDVVLTNAIAPGDEKAVLAAALSLPAGSTRSGRRVQRS